MSNRDSVLFFGTSSKPGPRTVALMPFFDLNAHISHLVTIERWRDLQETVPGVVFAVDNDAVHDSDPLAGALGNGDLRLVHDRIPTGIDLGDGKNATVGDAQIGAAEQERDDVGSACVRVENVAQKRQPVERGVGKCVVHGRDIVTV